MVGCRQGGKNSLDRNYLYLAERRGAVVLPQRTVTHVLEGEGGGYVVTHRRSIPPYGHRQSFRSRGVVFAAGALGTNRLLLRCRERGHLPRLSPCLGRVARTNSEVLVGARSRAKSERFCDGIAITSSLFVNKTTHIEPVRYPEGSDVMWWLSTLMTDGGTGLRRPLRYARELLRHPGRWLSTLSPLGWARRTLILLVMQTLDNRMELTLRRRACWPFVKTLSARGFSSTTPTWIESANDAARSLAKKVDGFPMSSVTEVLFNIPLTAHILGGCIMGADPDHGVVDSQCRVYGYENMYIVDGSMIPANLGVNPSLTITALAEYAMSKIPRKESE